MVGFLFVVHFFPLTWTASLPKPIEISAFVQQACDDLDFGNAEVEQFIRDRPDTADIIRHHSMLRRMLIWNFAGGLNGKRIYWGDNEPEGGADHIAGYGDRCSMVRVTKRESGIDKCTSLLFELLNVEIDKEGEILQNASPHDRKSRYEFAKSCVRDEFRVKEMLEWFFRKYPLEGATKEKDPYYTWISSSGMHFETYLRRVENKVSENENPIKYYGRTYDQIIKSRD
jgi:hypothetical protein